MKKTILTLVTIILAGSTIFAQDIIYTISGEINQSKTALDSILVENTANDTRILFENLPAHDYYQINLSKNAYWGTVGLNIFEDAPAFEVAQNLPGMLTIAYRKNTPTEVLLSVYNINGQRVFTPEKKILIAGNSINVRLSTSGVFIVRIEAPIGAQTFKAIGKDKQSDYVFEITDQTKSYNSTKSASLLNDADFSFSIGDSLRVSVYKNDYYAPPIGIYIVNSENINFLFEASATVKTENATDITYSSATLNGEVISDGGSTMNERGFYWSATNNTPDSGDNVEIVSGATGGFAFTLTGLTDDTHYYYVAFASNSEGIDTGDPVTFTTNKDTGNGQFTDSRDNHKYKTVEIGNQIWMAENLAYLPSVNKIADGSEDVAGSYYYVYGYDGTDVTTAKATSNYNTYGVLYNWTAAMASSASSTANPSGIQGVCPTGWHLPSDAEWTELTDYLDGVSEAGGKLKETGTTHWNSPNTGATNETGFTALPGGCRYDNGTFYYIGGYGFWWSATEDDASIAWYRYMYYDYSGVYRNYFVKEVGFSVRCVRD